MLLRDTCSSAGLSSCPTSLPPSFCCPPGSSCLPLAGGTTAVCCPAGQTCDRIQPITCDVSQQDPTNLLAPIKTSVAGVRLESCGGATCCPFGYSCLGGSECVRNADQSSPPSSSSTSSPTAAASPSATTAPTPSVSATTSSGSGAKSNPKTVSIVGGVIGGAGVLLLLTVLAVLYLRRPRAKRGISPPMPQGSPYRADFIRKRRSVLHSLSLARLSIPNPFDSHSPETPLTPGNREDYGAAFHGYVPVGSRLQPIRAMKVSSSRALTGSVASLETPGKFARRGTTFTDLMDEADLGDVRRGKPYVPGTPR